jgi:hypothetical protein
MISFIRPMSIPTTAIMAMGGERETESERDRYRESKRKRESDSKFQ